MAEVMDGAEPAKEEVRYGDKPIPEVVTEADVKKATAILQVLFRQKEATKRKVPQAPSCVGDVQLDPGDGPVKKSYYREHRKTVLERNAEERERTKEQRQKDRKGNIDKANAERGKNRKDARRARRIIAKHHELKMCNIDHDGTVLGARIRVGGANQYEGKRSKKQQSKIVGKQAGGYLVQHRAGISAFEWFATRKEAMEWKIPKWTDTFRKERTRPASEKQLEVRNSAEFKAKCAKTCVQSQRRRYVAAEAQAVDYIYKKDERMDKFKELCAEKKKMFMWGDDTKEFIVAVYNCGAMRPVPNPDRQGSSGM